MAQKKRLNVEKTLAKVRDLNTGSVFSAVFDANNGRRQTTTKKEKKEHVATTTHLGSRDLIKQQESANEEHA